MNKLFTYPQLPFLLPMLGMTLAGQFSTGLSSLLVGMCVGGALELYYHFIIKPRLYRAQANHVFSLACVRIAGAIAKADGRQSEGEIRTFKTYFHVPASQTRQVSHAFKGARIQSNLAEDIATLERVTPQQGQLRENIVFACYAIAYTDGSATTEQLYMLNKLARGLNLNSATQQNIADAFLRTQHAPIHEELASSNLTLTRAAVRLGVSPADDLSIIRKAYHKLAKKYHPDKLHAAKATAQEMNKAQQELAEINAAFDVLQRKKSRK